MDQRPSSRLPDPADDQLRRCADRRQSHEARRCRLHRQAHHPRRPSQKAPRPLKEHKHGQGRRTRKQRNGIENQAQGAPRPSLQQQRVHPRHFPSRPATGTAYTPGCPYAYHRPDQRRKRHGQGIHRPPDPPEQQAVPRAVRGGGLRFDTAGFGRQRALRA